VLIRDGECRKRPKPLRDRVGRRAGYAKKHRSAKVRLTRRRVECHGTIVAFPRRLVCARDRSIAPVVRRVPAAGAVRVAQSGSMEARATDHYIGDPVGAWRHVPQRLPDRALGATGVHRRLAAAFGEPAEPSSEIARALSGISCSNRQACCSGRRTLCSVWRYRCRGWANSLEQCSDLLKRPAKLLARRRDRLSAPGGLLHQTPPSTLAVAVVGASVGT
jgi:hypothetical protein